MKLRLIHGWLLGATLVTPAGVLAHEPGRKHWICVDNCATIPRGAQPAPPGTYVNGFIRVQDMLAESDDFVLYSHMWYRGGTQLGPLGRYQLDLISKRLAKVPFPVVVATSRNDELDEARREAIVNLLAMRGFTDATRVIVAYPIAEGLYGEEADRIAAQRNAGPFGLGTIPGVAGPGGFFGGFPGLFGFGR
jgi:hypothetical protein